MTDRIAFITNYNQYESKRYFTKHLNAAFERKGVETLWIELDQKPFDEEILRTIWLFQPDCTLSFNNFDFSPDTPYPWDILKIPHIAVLLDPAIYSLHFIRSPYCHLTSIDRRECHLLKQEGFNNVLFWPHAVEKELQPSTEKPLYPIGLFGSCYDHLSLLADVKKKYPPFVVRIIEDAVDIVFSGKYESLMEAFAEAWGAKTAATSANFRELFFYFDYYLRGLDRISLVRSIKNIPIHIFGGRGTDHPSFQHGWDHYFANQPNVTVHPPLPFAEAMEMQKRCLFTINSSPFFKDGSHERVFTSLACGALPITSNSTYLQEQFPNGEAIFYSPGHWNTIESQIQHLLSNEPLRQEKASQGRHTVMLHHTWDQSVDALRGFAP